MDISLHNIQSLYDEKQSKKKKLYDKILMRAITVMKESAQLGKNMCMYVVPELVLGMPVYNVEECVLYISDNLKSKGFETVFAKPNVVFIFWKLKNKLFKYNSNFSQPSLCYEKPSITYQIPDKTNYKSVKNINIPQTFFFNH